MNFLSALPIFMILTACSHVQNRGGIRAAGSPTSMTIPKRYVDLERLTFARVSSLPSDADYPSPAQEVKLKIDGEHLLLNDANAPHHEIARWKISGKAQDAIFVSPTDFPADHHYFHDMHAIRDGLWFHETVPSSVGHEKTWSIYLLTTTGTPQFSRQSPVKDIGYLVNYRDGDQFMIYDGKEPFNPNRLFITKWHNQKTIDWVISPAIPTEFIPSIQDGILAWNDILPQGMRFSVRLAAPGEEIDGPFTNAVVYQPAMTGGNAAASYTFHPASGEIFRAALVIGKLPNQLGQHGPNLRGSVTHEIGHVLGLRHNYKGSLYDSNLGAYPTGSSIMEYPDHELNGRRSIGPYDRDAIRWAYVDSSSTTTYPFCTEETQDLDPLCQPYDPTSSQPFGMLIVRVKSLLEKQLHQTDNVANFTLGKSPFDRMGAYVRLPDTAFYNARNNSSINELFTKFLESASNHPTPVGTDMAARHLQRIIDGAGFLGLSENHLKTALPALDAFIQWKTSHPSPSQ